MVTNVKQMLQAANEVVQRITPAQAREMISKGNTLVVDVRDAPEVQTSGKIAGADPRDVVGIWRLEETTDQETAA